MRYYLLPRIGTGSGADPFRPDVPEGTSWTGATDGMDYLVATPGEIPSAEEIAVGTALESVATARGLDYDDVLRWRVVP